MKEKELIEVFKPKMEKCIILIKEVMEEMQEHGCLNSVRYPELYQAYLNWLDELNEISVTN